MRPRVLGFEPHWRHCIVSLSKNINLSLVLVQPRDRSLITERLLMGRKVSNQTKTKSNLWDWSSFKKVRPDFFELFTLIGIEFATRMIRVTQVRVQSFRNVMKFLREHMFQLENSFSFGAIQYNSSRCSVRQIASQTITICPCLLNVGHKHYSFNFKISCHWMFYIYSIGGNNIVSSFRVLP